MQFTTTLLTLLATTTALAAPVDNVSSRKVATDKTTCTAYRNDLVNIDQSVFEVTIGRPYLGGGRCKELRAKIRHFADVNYMKCSGARGKANTKLTIHSSMKPKSIANMNKGLRNAYPEITFHCPTTIANP